MVEIYFSKICLNKRKINWEVEVIKYKIMKCSKKDLR